MRNLANIQVPTLYLANVGLDDDELSGQFFMSKIHIATFADSIQEATRHAEVEGGQAKQAYSFAAFERALESLYENARATGWGPLTGMDFHGHGPCSGGELQFEAGDSNLSVVTAYGLAVAPEGVFAPRARIRFVSCAAARGPHGEALLVVFGKRMLFHSGGIAEGNTELGTSNIIDSHVGQGEPSFGSGGHIVRARVRPGGAVSLSGHRYLHPARLRDRADLLRRALGAGDVGLQARCAARDTASCQEMMARLQEIEGMLAGQPSYEDAFRALRALEEIEDPFWSQRAGNRYRPPFPDHPVCEVPSNDFRRRGHIYTGGARGW